MSFYSIASQLWRGGEEEDGHRKDEGTLRGGMGTTTGLI